MWRDTRIWLAITQPFSRDDLGGGQQIQKEAFISIDFLPIAKDKMLLSALTTLNFLIIPVHFLVFLHTELKQISLGTSLS